MVQLILSRTLLLSITVALLSVGCRSDDDDDGDDSPPPAGDLPAGSADAGPGVCRGQSTACELLSKALCDQTFGCHQGSACVGVAASCASITSSSVCLGVGGCNWSVNRCRGTASTCASWITKSDCGTHSGCSWFEGCVGTPPACSDRTSQATCGFTAGCKWTPL